MGILFGGDYNPEQWPREVWDEDMELFRVASVNTVTINVFAWALLQKSENEYNFTELDEIVRRHAQAGHHIIMATSTSTVPAWLARKYPEVLRTDYHGVHKKFGKRHNFCPNSPDYRQYAGMLVCWYSAWLYAIKTSVRSSIGTSAMNLKASAIAKTAKELSAFG